MPGETARRAAPTAGVPTPPSPRRAEAARRTITSLAATQDVFETFFERAEIGLALADLSGRYVRVNVTYAALLDHRPEDLVGVEISTVLHPEQGNERELEALLSGARAGLSSEQRHTARDGSLRWVLHGVTVVQDAAGTPAWLAVSAQDITERRHAESELRSLTAALTERAVRDPLTGLANRVLLEERLRAALARDARSGASTGVLFLDLDGFKDINDRHGHAAGDRVLTAVAARLARAVRPSDTVARLGGDEFVVLVEQVSEPGLGQLAERLRASVRAPLAVAADGERTVDVCVGVSIGEAISAGGDDDPASLLARADQAMYRAKAAAGPVGAQSCDVVSGRAGEELVGDSAHPPRPRSRASQRVAAPATRPGVRRS